MTAQLTVYIRQGCHLCDDMLETLAQYSGELDYTYECCDIDSQADWQQQYNDWVPVVTLDGQQLFHYFFELATLQAALQQSKSKGQHVSTNQRLPQ